MEGPRGPSEKGRAMKLRMEFEIEQFGEVHSLVETIDKHRAGAALLLLAVITVGVGLFAGWLIWH